MKVDRARKIEVLRDTTTFKFCEPSENVDAGEDTIQFANKLVDLTVLQLLKQTYDIHIGSRPQGFMEMWALIRSLLGLPQCFHEDQLHLHEFAALECDNFIKNTNYQLL